MEEKTEQLRDLFLDVADEETVTESQAETRGSLAGPEDSSTERLRVVVDEMRDRFEFDTDLHTEALCRIVRLFYDGTDDADLATTLDITPEQAFRARMDLHLVQEDVGTEYGDELDEATLDAVREATGDGDGKAVAERVAADRDTVERALAVIEARNRSRRTSHRFRTRFEEILTDADLKIQFAADVHEDGLEEATAGSETDIQF